MTKQAVIDSSRKAMESLKGSTDMKDILCQEWNNKEDILNAKDINIVSDLDFPFRGYCFLKMVQL